MKADTNSIWIYSFQFSYFYVEVIISLEFLNDSYVPLLTHLIFIIYELGRLPIAQIKKLRQDTSLVCLSDVAEKCICLGH